MPNELDRRTGHPGRCRICRPLPAASAETCCCRVGHNFSDHLLDRVITANGIDQFRRVCLKCGDSSSFIRKSEVSPMATVRHERDHRPRCCRGVGCPLCQKQRCERCNSYEHLEWHHWAPRHVFGADCESWPKSWLCRQCHAEWHRLVTPRMGRSAA